MARGTKRDTEKPDHSLLPRIFLDQVSYVMEAGAKKYGRGNYQKGHELTRLTAAASRHLAEINNGEWYDAETTKIMGKPIPHWACVAANALMALHEKELGTLIDNRTPERLKPVVYISGGMRGIALANLRAFRDAATYARTMGWAPIIPHDLPETIDATVPGYMVRDMAVIAFQADAVYMLNGWRESLGATAEHAFALSISRPVFYERDACPPERPTLPVAQVFQKCRQ